VAGDNHPDLGNRCHDHASDMKAYIYSAIILAIIGGAWWLDHHGYKRALLELEVKTANQKVEIEKAKRAHDETKRQLAGETRAKLDALSRITTDACYRLDDPLPESAVGILRQSGHR